MDGHDARGREIHIVVWDEDGVVFNQLSKDDGHTTLHGQVGADAKLDSLEVEDVVTHVTRVGGSSKPGVYDETVTITRSARGDMRTGTYTPGEAKVKVLVRYNGRWPGAEYDQTVASKASQEYAKDFGATVEKAISRYRAREAGWNQPNACARIDWAPASNTLRLRNGDRGRALATISAAAGGTAADGVTRIASRANGTFTPAEARGGSPGFDYTVTSPEAGVLVLTVEATSTAGVARAAWEQPIVKPTWAVTRISGSFSGEDDAFGVTTTWSGTATWQRATNLDEGNTSRRFTLFAATYVVTKSGVDGNGCHISGQKQFTVGASATPAFTVLNPAADVVFGGSRGDWELPWDYFWNLNPPTPPLTMVIELSGCDSAGMLTVSGPTLTSGLHGVTADGYRFSGSVQNTPSSSESFSETWDFTGTE